jgi:hypothetical protein
VYPNKVGPTQVKPNRIARTWDEYGKAHVRRALEKQHAYGSNVTNRSNEAPSTTSFPSVAYLKLYVICWGEYHNRLLRSILIGKAFSILQSWLEKRLGEPS